MASFYRAAQKIGEKMSLYIDIAESMKGTYIEMLARNELKELDRKAVELVGSFYRKNSIFREYLNSEDGMPLLEKSRTAYMENDRKTRKELRKIVGRLSRYSVLNALIIHDQFDNLREIIRREGLMQENEDEMSENV